jgi:hypothetical protein
MGSTTHEICVRSVARTLGFGWMRRFVTSLCIVFDERSYDVFFEARVSFICDERCCASVKSCSVVKLQIALFTFEQRDV